MMKPTVLYLGIAAGLCFSLAHADEHVEKALEHANEAANSAGDSKAVATHATEALKHIEAAKSSRNLRPETVRQLSKSEADLKAAVKNANRYNTNAAAQDAADGKAHLDAAIRK